MLEDLAKLCQVCIIDLKLIKSLEITLHAICKSLIDQFNDFIIFELLHCSTMWREKHKIIDYLMPMCKVLANGHQTMKMDLLQVAFLHLKSIFGENVLRDIWKMFCLWISTQIFAWTIMIIEYPMIQFLAMRYFFCACTECTMIKQAFSGYALLITE